MKNRLFYLFPLFFAAIYSMEFDQAKKKDSSPKSETKTEFTLIDIDTIREGLGPLLVQAWNLKNGSPIAEMMGLKLVDLGVSQYSDLRDPALLENSSKILESLGEHRSHRNAIKRLLKASAAMQKAREDLEKATKQLNEIELGLIAQKREESGLVLQVPSTGEPKDIVIINNQKDISLEKATEEFMPLVHLLLIHQQQQRDLLKNLS